MYPKRTDITDIANIERFKEAKLIQKECNARLQQSVFRDV